MTHLTKAVASRLQTARKTAGFKSAKAFADKMNIHPVTYSQHESGKRAISLKNLLRYCDLLNLDLNFLVFGNHQSNNYLNISKITTDTKLYNQILSYLVETISVFPITASEMIDFCTDVYNSISKTSASEDDRQKMIKLSISSLIRGYNKPPQNNLLKINEK